MAHFNKKKAKLKEDIVKYLRTCESQKCRLGHFWSEMASFTKSNMSRKAYGVRKMHSLLDEFKDIVSYDDNYVYLQIDSDVPLIISDSSEEDSQETNQSHLRGGNLGAANQFSGPASQAWGSGFMAATNPGAGMSTPGDRSRSSSVSSASGFIAFSGADSPEPSMALPGNQGQLSHQRYGLGTQAAGQRPGHPMMERPPPLMMERPPHHMMERQPNPLMGRQPNPSMERLPNPSMERPPIPLMGQSPGFPMQSPLMNTPIRMPPQNMAQNFMQNFQMLSQSPQMTAYASPALMTSPISPFVSQPSGQTEWPKPVAKTGPPPGTKITDEEKEIIVRPIPLARGARLSSEQVNHEVTDCIEILSEAKAHVAIERVEQLVLQKFKVGNFRDLHLRERYFDQLPAAKEHSLKLGKVNNYIQNFVRTRSLCSLYELKECCREFHPEKKDFEHLKLGPLQKMPMVYEMFKFPEDEYIPEITSMDILENLHCFLDRSNKWTQPVNMEEFMSFLMNDVYKVTSGYSLGVRLRSLPLCIQMLKKSKRDEASTRKDCIKSLLLLQKRDVENAFKKFRASILQTSQDGEEELRLHYMNLAPEDAMREIITKFELLSQIFLPNLPHTRKVDKMQKHFEQFIKSVLDVPVPRVLLHLSVCLSNLEVQESAKDFIEQQARQQEQEAAAGREQREQQAQKKPPPTKVGLLEKVVTYINKCLDTTGALHLSHLQRIESKILEDFKFPSFQEMGYGRFLDFILSETKIKAILEECGGTVLGSSSGGHDAECMYKPNQTELLEFILQSKRAGVGQIQQVDSIICEQYRVSDIKHLGHGNITRLSSSAERPGRHASKEYHVLFEAAICGNSCPTTRSTGQVGIQGSQTKETAMACLTACPLLEDMAEWSHWSLIFQPQFGRLRDFVEKYGGVKMIPLEGGNKTATSDFMALEVEPGKLLKICSQSSPELFVAALEAKDPMAAAGHLVSLIVANKGLDSTPLALLSTHMKGCLAVLHALSPSFSTPGGPPSQEMQKTVDLAVQFVTEMLLRLPVRICAAVANQVLLEPLSQVVGSAKSKSQIVQACRLPQQRQKLELLGCILGLPEWASSLQQRFEFPPNYVEETVADDLLGETDLGVQQKDEEDEEEEEEEEDSEDESDSDVSDSDLFADVDTSEVLGSERNEETEESKEKEVKEDGGSDENDDDEDEEEDDQDDEKEEDGEKEEGEVGKGVSETGDKKQDGKKQKGLSKTGEEEEEEEEERVLTREEMCRHVVDDIRREEFGVGIKLNEAGEKLMKKQQERQGRSLQRLSKDLYSKDTHFVLELIQNADDNSYSEDIVPAVKFSIDSEGVTVMNNELGFEEKNIRALCDVGKSTKSKHQLGYIGQKGIGFKSVFRVTGRPEIHSNGFHIYFDVTSGPIGYILPHWGETVDSDEGWQTRIALPWTEEIKQQIKSHAARFNDIQPSLLLFLHRLKEITIENKVEGSSMYMRRKDLADGEVQISHNFGVDRWLVLKKVLDASGVSLQMKSGVEVESTEIALAFPLKDKTTIVHSKARPSKLPVFAFLPLRSYGFRFIVQGDFDVPSSREDVNRDSSWNQWLRNEIHVLFIEAFEAFKARADLTPVEALIMYMQFVPMEGEVMDFFKPVASQILAQLRAKECMPVLAGDKKDVIWKMPSKTVVTRDALVLEIISPDSLQSLLGLYYLHPDVTSMLNDPLIQALGVETVTTEHLLHIGRSIGQNWDVSESSEHVTDLAKWLACVYRSLDDFAENTQTIETLCKLKVIPLSDGNLVSLSDMTVFMLTDEYGKPAEGKGKKKGNVKDPLLELKKDLNLVHSELTNTNDNEVNSQVVKLLLKMGIKQMTAHDLIHSHIMPVLKSDAWKEKTRDVLISYLVYIKSEREHNPSIIDVAELRPVVRLATNHGIKLPVEDDVHFPPSFGNKVDLQKTFPGIEWTVVDRAYLPYAPSNAEVVSWHDFLSDLGVVDFLRVKKVEMHFDKDKIHETPWADYKDLWPDSPDGYTIVDFQCEEFYSLATASQPDAVKYRQMVDLYEMLDMAWNTAFSRYTSTQLKSGSGHVLKEIIKTSFAVHLHTLPWVPAAWTTASVLEDGKTVDEQDVQELQTPAELYVQDRNIEKLLAHTVKYSAVEPQRKSNFTSYLGIKSRIDVQTVKKTLISWCERAEGNKDIPRSFCSSVKHMAELYKYLHENLIPKDAQDLFHDYPAIFVPNQQKPGDMLVAGKMMSRDEVWWADPSGLFTKYRDSMELYKAPLAKRKIVEHVYPHLEELFCRTARISAEPNTFELAQLLKHIATVHAVNEGEVLADVLQLFSSIGRDLSKIDDKVGGVKTPQASQAEVFLPKVIELLTKAAVFPTQQEQWVSLTDCPMIVDSAELEEMFRGQPGVHFLTLEVRETGIGRDRHRGAMSSEDKEFIKYFLSLFEAIKPLSECVKTEEITSGFQQCIKGQTYMHKIVGLVQKFLYFLYPPVYDQVKAGKAKSLKELLFSQVERLEVRYELKDRPDIFQIRHEKCVVKDKNFFFHEMYVSSLTEINKEVAKYFSEGNERCDRALRNFLAQAASIIDGKSDETIEELFGRQEKRIGSLPGDEEVWEIPLPIIPVIEEPEPEPVEEEEKMVYGRALSVPGEAAASGASAGDGENTGLKSWPPRSGLVKEKIVQDERKGDSAKPPTGMWPPPQSASHTNPSRQLPSNIKFETESPAAGAEKDEKSQTTADRSQGSSQPGHGQTVFRQSSQGGEGKDVARQTSSSGDGRSMARQHSQTSGDGQSIARQRSDGDEGRRGTGGDGDRQSSGTQGRRREGDGHGSEAAHTGGGGGGGGGSGGGGSSGGRMGDSSSTQAGVRGQQGEVINAGKRKLTEGSREDGEGIAFKRLNSDEHSQVQQAEGGDHGGRTEGNRTFVQQGGGEGRGEGGGDRESAEGRGESSHGSSSREVTPSSSSSNQDTRQPNKSKGVLQFTFPIWSDSSEDVAYTELTRGEGLTIPPLPQGEDSQKLEIGMWGEMLVLDYLMRQKNLDAEMEAVLWANAEGEKGLPYDFEIVFKSGNEGELRSMYIEVKATVSWDKEVFSVSSKQVEFALQQRDNYEIYRVFGAGNPNPRLVRVDNVAERMKTKAVKLFMVL